MPLTEGGLGLSQRHLAELQEIQDSGSNEFFKLGVRDGQLGIKFQQFAGVVNFTDGTSLEILPKPPGADLETAQARDLIVDMVRVANRAPDHVGRVGSSQRGDSLQELFISATLEELQRQVSKGFHRAFSTKIEEGRALRGKLMLGQQLSRYPGRHDRFIQSYPAWSYDTDINGVILAALKSMIIICRDRRMLEELRRMAAGFAELDVSLPKNFDRDRTFHRLDSRWHTAFTLCMQWLNRTLPTLRANGELVGPSLLFDMNNVFERYVRESLVKVVPSLVQELVKPTTMFESEHGRGVLTLLPDVEVGKRGDCGSPLPIVCDAKWKDLRKGGGWNLDPSDLRQMYAYAKILGFGRAALIFPTMDKRPRLEKLYSRDRDRVELTILELPLGRTRTNERDRLLAELVYGELCPLSQA